MKIEFKVQKTWYDEEKERLILEDILKKYTLENMGFELKGFANVTITGKKQTRSIILYIPNIIFDRETLDFKRTDEETDVIQLQIPWCSPDFGDDKLQDRFVKMFMSSDPIDDFDTFVFTIGSNSLEPFSKKIQPTHSTDIRIVDIEIRKNGSCVEKFEDTYLDIPIDGIFYSIENLTEDERIEYYTSIDWYDKRAGDDSSLKIRLMYNKERLWVFEKAKTDEFPEVRYGYYEDHGWKDIDAKNDSDYKIRLAYYNSIQWLDLDAKIDPDYRIRLTYYNSIEWSDPDALNDSNSLLKQSYELYNAK